ncbi:efflux transporter outer membrane subunit [Pseudoduganella eburnea]|uniref:Efflux transporter outer membrane subunit n=1 Tax=Massilia eburnea TaxID=1776165 RepID=A0A6L6QQF7_9BURK|nr:TolC family protein [Massilia eburnea]MTW13783.1 efflux transporter outer membrane subunit [Massilia eburnea]
MKRTLSLAATLALAACSHAPQVARYQPPAQASFVNAPEQTANDEPVAEFWQRFEDDQLSSLIQRALKANTDVRTAAANLAESRAVERLADADLWPTVNLGAGAARIRAKDGNGVPKTNNAYSVGLDVLWEVDVFGRLSDARRAAQAGVLAGEAGYRAAQLSVAAEVARNYFNLRGLQEQLRVAVASLETQRAALQLVEAREGVGRGTALDTERARALVNSTAASVPAFESALARVRYRLAVLCGLPPTGLDDELKQARALPGLKSYNLGGIGTPENLLRRRPDVQVAEAQLAAASANAGVARSAWFPTITLGGTLGQNASHIGDIGKGSSYAYNLGAQLAWNLLDFGRIRANIAASDARAEAAAVNYERAVLAALEETEGAFVNYTKSQQQAALLYDAVVASEQAAHIARERFAVGSTDFLVVLDAERELLSARDRLAQAQAGAASSLVLVYKALAGGWGG